MIIDCERFYIHVSFWFVQTWIGVFENFGLYKLELKMFVNLKLCELDCGNLTVWRYACLKILNVWGSFSLPRQHVSEHRVNELFCCLWVCFFFCFCFLFCFVFCFCLFHYFYFYTLISFSCWVFVVVVFSFCFFFIITDILFANILKFIGFCCPVEKHMHPDPPLSLFHTFLYLSLSE